MSGLFSPASSRGRMRLHHAAGWRVFGLGMLVVLVLGLMPLSGCGSATSGRAASDGKVQVIAAENFWGSLVSQLGGSHVRVISIVADPNTDPHDYESSASAARNVAGADYVIQNGAGYDDWMSKLLAASPNPARRVFNVGAYLGKRPGDNPHLWYNPDYVTAAENHIEADLKALDPRGKAYFTARRKATDAAFAGVRAQLAQIRRTDAGRRVASTESIFVYLARYLGLYAQFGETLGSGEAQYLPWGVGQPVGAPFDLIPAVPAPLGGLACGIDPPARGQPVAGR